MELDRAALPVGGTLLIPSDSARGLVRLGFVVVSTAYVLLWPTRRPRARNRSHEVASGGRLPTQDTSRADRTGPLLSEVGGAS